MKREVLAAQGLWPLSGPLPPRRTVYQGVSMRKTGLSPCATWRLHGNRGSTNLEATTPLYKILPSYHLTYLHIDKLVRLVRKDKSGCAAGA
jgi:hypothetical protein